MPDADHVPDGGLLAIADRFRRRERRLRARFVLTGAALVAGPPLGAWFGWWSWWLTASCVLTVAGSAEYLGWYAICFAHGLVHAPSRPWQLRISGDALHISADDLTATLPLDRIYKATWRFDDDFETLKGIEGVLCLSLDDGRSVPVHEGAEGFWTLLAALDARALVTRVPLGDRRRRQSAIRAGRTRTWR